MRLPFGKGFPKDLPGLTTLRRAGAAIALCLAGPALAAPAERTEAMLDNGLKVIVIADHRMPVVVSQIWYRAGSVDEIPGRTGVAHVLEHMMFRGTENVPPGEFSRIIAREGGEDNAFTSRDYTAYYQKLEKSRLPLALRLEADRMQNLSMTDDDFQRELNVVMEERRWRTEDRPQSLLWERFNAASHIEHPYRHPVIGWMDDLKSLSADDARNWYRRWYVPNNAVLVVAGDVEAEGVLDLVREHFGAIPSRELPRRPDITDPEPLGTQRLTVKAPAELPVLIMGWPAPRAANLDDARESWALMVLAGVLSGNPSARLGQALVRDSGLAVDVGAGYNPISRGPARFTIAGSPSEGHDVQALETAIRAQLQRVVEDGITPAELERVKAQVVADKVFEQDSLFHQALLAGMLETIGHRHDGAERIVAGLRAVQAGEVREVARKYLVDDALTVAVLEPQPLDSGRPATPPAGGRHAY